MELKNTGVLIIHGFAGSRDEIRPLARHLEGNGFAVEIPVLRGHEADLKELSKATRSQWREDAVKAYDKLAQRCERIVVIGFSMGGLIAADLYQSRKFYKLVTVNTPIYYWDFKIILKNIMEDFSSYSKKYFASSTNKPLRSLWQFQRLLSETKPLFGKIDCSALLVQVKDDDTVNAKSVDYIYKQLTGPKRIYRHDKGGHIIFQSRHCGGVLHSISEFVIQS